MLSSNTTLALDKGQKFILAVIILTVFRRLSVDGMEAASSPVELQVGTVPLPGGWLMPLVGYGLYQIPADASEEAVLNAIRLGYRHLDSASFYMNEAGVGRAIQRCGVPREELFIASKVWTDCIGEGRAFVRSSIEKSLELLQVQYLDLAYVHWPVPGMHVEAYEELEMLVREGKVKAIGLSNYRIEDYEELMNLQNSSNNDDTHKRIPPAVNQIEVNPFLYREDTIDYFKAKNIQVIAYKPLLRGKGIDHPIVVKIANKLGTTPADVLLKWGVRKGLALLPKSSNAERMRANLLSCCSSSAQLEDEDVKSLDALTDPIESKAAFEGHFAKRAVVDPSRPTIDAGYGPSTVEVGLEG